MTRPKNPDETSLLIKLPPELKASFQGLCKFRNVSVSAELRRFMADEVAKTARGMTTKDNPDSQKPSHARVSLSGTDKVVMPRKSYKDAVQADLVLNDTAASAIKAKAARDKRKPTNKKKKR
jgi:hypothetical protein